MSPFRSTNAELTAALMDCELAVSSHADLESVRAAVHGLVEAVLGPPPRARPSPGSDPVRHAVEALVSGRVREVRPKVLVREDGERTCGVKVVLDWNGVECPLAETPSGSLQARRDMIVAALADLCMSAVDLHDCCAQVVSQVHDR